MRDSVEALLLEDDPEQLAEIQALLSTQGLNVISRRDVKGALTQLDPEYHNPVVAVIDWDMSKSGEPHQKNSAKVLEALRDNHPGCTPIVYSANLNTPIIRADIRNANVRSLLVDKAMERSRTADDHRGLMQTLDAIFAKARFGDLEWFEGKVRQVNTTNMYFHRVGAMILLNKTIPRPTPRPLNLYQKSTLTKALHRMNNWLIENGSPVRVASLNGWQYDLVLEEPAGRKKKSAAA